MTFTISAPPHRKSPIHFRSIMWGKVLALLPVSLVSIYFFGLPALSIILAGTLAAVITEAGIQKIFSNKLTINDGNAVLIGLMLSLVMPPEAPLWLPVVGSFFAISIGKHAFGGIGSYVFNPVLAAWIFISSSWPNLMSPVSTPHVGQLSDFVLENGAGLLVDVSPIALIGGVYLIYRGFVEWRVPVAFFLTMVLFPQTLNVLFAAAELIRTGVLNPLMYLSLMFKFLDPSIELNYSMVGAVFFGILFIATDTPTSPVTKKGRIIYGMVCGLLVSIYGYFDNYVAGTFYGLFLANSLSSFIETTTRPASFGSEGRAGRFYRRLTDKLPSSLKMGVLSDE
ncbi:MAG: Rnf electron transport complex subunit RnfD [Methanomethylovorans sp.]|uniref:Rnf electron transport complex subunit RnfD n=1 Tax=Methanomethylovorans sp. TaxID=2758717 RepID=UPI00345EBB59